jgi:hypothetical protein
MNSLVDFIKTLEKGQGVIVFLVSGPFIEGYFDGYDLEKTLIRITHAFVSDSKTDHKTMYVSFNTIISWGTANRVP